MATSELRKKIRALILGITGIIIALIFMRVVIDFLDPSVNSGFAKIIKEITDLLISPMEGLIELSTASEIDQLNVTGLLAIFIYFITGLILAEVITAFIYDNAQDVVLNVVDGIFKVIEFIIFLRIIFDLLQVNQKVNMVSTVYSLTDWAEGAVVDLKLLDDRLDISMILILIFIVILDIVSEGLLKGMLSSGNEGSFSGSSSNKTTHQVQNITHVHAAQPTSNYANLLPQQPVPRKPVQNITVNVPAPQQIPQVMNTYNIPQPARQAIPQSRSMMIPQDTIVSKPTEPKPEPKEPLVVNKVEKKKIETTSSVENTNEMASRAEVSEPVRSFESKKTENKKQENPVKVLEPKPLISNAKPSFGQSYTVQSLPSRFRTSTMYGKTPKSKQVSIGTRVKKLFGS